MCRFFCARGVWGADSGWFVGGVAPHLSRSFSGGVSWLLEGFGSVSMSMFTVAALVHDPPASLSGTVSSAVAVPSVLEMVYFLSFLGSLPQGIPSVFVTGMQASNLLGAL